MVKMAAIILVLGSSIPAIAEQRPPQLPENTIDCAQFTKTGPSEWIEVETAVFNLGKIKDIHLSSQPVTPGFFKFDGIDVFPVLEQKCGGSPSNALRIGSPSNAKGEAPVTLAQSGGPKAEFEQSSSSPAAAQMPVQAPINGSAPPSGDKMVKRRPETLPCGEQKLVYAADGSAEVSDKPTVEIVFDSGINSNQHSEFTIREFRTGQHGWAYKGKIRQRRFIFTLTPSKQRNVDRFIFASMGITRQDSVVLSPIFIKPNRGGTAEAILHLSGLRALFAKNNLHRFKFEGGHPSESLPETYYFDRCESH